MEGFCTSLENSKRKCGKYCFVPQRYVVAVMGALGVLCALLLRNSAFIILYFAVNDPQRDKTHYNTICTKNYTSKNEVKLKFDDVYNWNYDEMVKVDTFFFYGYFLGHLPGGYLGDMYGGKHVFGGTVFLSAVLTTLMPLIVKQSRSVTGLVYLRLMLGIIQGALYPSLNSVISCWTPTRDRGKITGIVFSADLFAIFVNNTLISKLLQYMPDWSHIIYWYSGASVFWWVLWNLLCYSYPSKCPFLSEKEKAYLEEQLEGHVSYGKKKVPFYKLLSSTPLWMLVFIEIASDWIFFSVVDDLPNYLTSVLNYRFSNHRLASTVPNGICGIACIFNGILADYILNMHWLSVTTLRQVFVTVGVMGPPIFIVAATFGGCNLSLTMTMFTIAFTLLASFYTGGRIVTLDLAPNYSGLVMAVVNGMGTLSGALPPKIEGFILIKKELLEWRKVFSVALGISALANLLFSIWGSGKEQPWNNPNQQVRKEDEEKEEEKVEEEEKEEKSVDPYTY